MRYNELDAFRELIHDYDSYTCQHCDDVTTCSLMIAERLGWNRTQLNRLRWMAETHDIGKIGVRREILTKPGRLTNDEYKEIQAHTTYGSNFLKQFCTMRSALGIHYGALYHHERYDGRGYPTGTSGKNIPIEARIIGLADAYDAMASDRCYRQKLSDSAILHELAVGRGTQWDPALTDILIDIVTERMAS